MAAIADSSKNTTKREAGPVVDFSQLMQCPVASKPFEHFGLIDELRKEDDIHFGDASGHPFWAVTAMEPIREAFQHPQIFSNTAVVPDAPEPLVAANRDENEFPNPDGVVIDRTENRHIAFGAGPHRCLGAHLARLELNIALQEWQRRIPDYRVDPSIPIREHGGQIGLSNLPLEWDVQPAPGSSSIAHRAFRESWLTCCPTSSSGWHSARSTPSPPRAWSLPMSPRAS